MRKRRKRILCAALSVLLVITSFQVAPIRRVKAAALAVEASDEIAAFLWNLCVNCMIIDGAEKIVVPDYETEKTLYEAFLNFMGIYEHADLGSITFSDGTYIDMADVFDGTGALEIPTEEEWAEFRVIDGGGGSSGNPEDPEEDFFTNIQQVVISSEFVSNVIDFGLKLWNGEIEGIEPGQYMNIESSYTGTIPQGTDGSYLYNGYIRYVNQSYYGGAVEGQYEISRSSAGNHDFCLVKNVSETNVSFYTLKQYATGEYGLGSVTFDGQTSGISGINYGSCLEFEINVNFPVFESESAALFYLQTGIDAECINGLCYDFPGLVNSLLEVLHPLTGINLNPSAIQGLQQALLNAYANLSALVADSAVNTENYIKAMTEAVAGYAEVMPEPDPLPRPEPDPEPESESESESEEEESPGDVDVSNYVVDLSELFPFCIPFDFIALLNVLDAEPEAPSFEIPFVVPALGIDERYKVDLSMFDEQMAIIRKFEMVGFVFVLIYLTGKFIKW